MIYVLHGQDSLASYSHLQSLLKKYPNHQEVYFSQENSLEQLQNAIFGQNFFNANELFVCQNFISDKKVKVQQLEKIVTNKTIIFWEEEKLALGRLKSSEISTLEFKLPTTLFQFLDSISPKSIAPLIYIRKMSDKTAINWHLLNRILLLILAKKNLSRQDAEDVMKKAIASWQWQKILTQAENFQLTLLYQMFNALLQVDLMKKHGKTEADYSSLIELLLIKYLRPPQMIQ